MKKIIALLAFLYAPYALMAQMPGGAPGGAPGAARQAMPNMGHIYGKLLDKDNKPVPFASVMVMQSKFDTATKKQKDVLVKGMITEMNGEFNFEDLPVMGIKVKVSATNYKAYEKAVSFAPAGGKPSFDKDLGNIKLEGSVSQLQGVEVTASKPMMTLDIDKKVFNVEKNIVSAGGTAVDVMKNVPSVAVDIDGNVSLRNSAPQLYVDGRPTTLTLDQIPADAIESVEVITNPSAKYDASGGGAGILNIVLKKNKKTGYNGNLRAGIDKRGAVNGGGDVNYRQDKFNFSASINANQNKSRTNGYTDRDNLGTTPLTSLLQTNNNRNNGAFVFGRAGIDYFLSNRTTISVSGVKVHGKFKPDDVNNITTDSLFNTGITSSFSHRTTEGERTFNANGLVLGFKQLFPREGEELTADFNYFGGKHENYSLFNTDYFSGAAKTGNELQRILGDGKMSNTTIQTDYVRPIAKTGKLETGLRAQLRTTENNNFNYIYSEASQDYVLIPSTSSNYKNKDNVYAAYLSFSNSIGKFGYKVGLRAESSEYEGELLQTGEKFSNSYPVSLFPSLFLSQKLNKDQELQLSYTRRVNRPNFFQLIPFADSTDKLNITRGNPNLVPEFTQSVEASYAKTFNANHSLLASAYFKHTDDLITNYLEKVTDDVTGSEALINTFTNANSSYSYGTEVTLINKLTKWWDISTSVNVYNSKINTDNVSGSSQDAMWSMFGKFNSNFKLPASFDVQLSATFQSKTNLPINNNPRGFGGPGMSQAQSAAQGYIKPFGGVDLAVKKSFLKNNALSATLAISDIFRTMKTIQYSESEYFTQYYSRLRDPQMLRLTLAYRFGKVDASLFKRKSQGTGNSGMEGMQ
ncbi:TonB-dependent receptor [Chitinophaga horti]|uniref:TonB-dependent receptor n=1 Tax=Chitinophaga horti TaxID=2920382 RepID=A0ABY6J665_9BACT|nr:outer membrane beta-barrel protein [Chitinophaga horti]UYQ95175.1 TonB-dependent receptor [Chitinophaga horti]